MKKNIKAIIILSIVLTAYTIGVVLYASNKNKKTDNKNSNNTSNTTIVNPPKKEEEDDINIVITPNTVLSHKNDIWYENRKFDFVDKTFDVYANETYKGVGLTYTDKWYIMEKDRNFIDYDITFGFVAVSSKLDVTSTYLDEKELTEEDLVLIKDYLEEKKVMYNIETIKKYKYHYDVNNDGIRDEIYVVTNVFLSDYTGFDKTYSYIFVKTLNKTVTVLEDVTDNINALNMCLPSFRAVINTNDNPLLLFDCSYFSAGGTKEMLYNVTATEATKVVESKAN